MDTYIYICTYIYIDMSIYIIYISEAPYIFSIKIKDVNIDIGRELDRYIDRQIDR